MKKSLFIYAIITIICCMSVNVYAANFNDVSGHWAESFINRWSEEKVINGYEDGTFKPNNNITRAEFIAMIMRIFEPNNKADISKYADVNNSSWYYDALARGYAMGAIQGYEDNTMKPESNITRQEAMVILNRILSLTSNGNSDEFIDANEIATWAKDAITAFSENKYINGYEDGSIHPTAYITRAEITKILDKSISKIITQSGEVDLFGINGSIVVKAENVILKNEEGIQKVFALNDQVKSSLETSKMVTVINASSNVENIIDTNKENVSDKNSGGNGVQNGSATTDKTFKIILKTSGNKYEVEKVGELVDGSKVTLVVDGKTIFSEKTFSKDNFFQFKLDLVSALKNAAKNKSINIDRFVSTLKDVKEDLPIDLETDMLDFLSDDEKAFIEELLGDSGKSFKDLYKGLSDEELMNLGTMIFDMDYDTAKNILEKM